MTETDDGYTSHANTKLTVEQLAYIEGSGECVSQWIREAVQQRIDTEKTDLTRTSCSTLTDRG